LEGDEVILDQKLTLQAYQPATDYLGTYPGIRWKDPETDDHVLFIGNSTALRALSICAI